MNLTIWRLLRPYIRHPVRNLSAIAALAAISGTLEACVLVVVVQVALAITRGSAHQLVELPVVGLSSSPTTLLWIAAGIALLLLGLHTVIAKMSSTLSAEVLESSRRRAIGAYLQASWPTQAVDREGALQETISTLSLQSSTLCVSFTTALSAILNLVALLAIALIVDPLAMLIVIAFGGLLFGAVRPVSRLTHRRANAFVSLNSDFSEEVSKAASLAMEFRLFGVNNRFRDELLNTNQRVASEQLRTRFASLFGVSLYRDLAVLFLVGAVGALYLVGGGRLAQMSAVVLLVVRALAYATLFQGMLQQITEYAPNLSSLDERLIRLEEAAESYGGETPESLGTVELVSVTYEYEPGVRALTNVNFAIRPGETIGIIGASGSGKSTLLQVLLRLRVPTTGQVYAAEMPYREIATSCWARQVALVPQEPRLMEATVEENIRFHRPELSLSDIESAADAASIADEIRNLPRGFQTMLGPRGGGLSGGQKQRVAIARALVGAPQLLVLDEPTSALDSASEQRLQATIEKLKGHIAMVIVAHRLSTLDACDRLIRLTGGELTEVVDPDTASSVLEDSSSLPVDEVVESAHTRDGSRGLL